LTGPADDVADAFVVLPFVLPVAEAEAEAFPVPPAAPDLVELDPPPLTLPVAEAVASADFDAFPLFVAEACLYVSKEFCKLVEL
jgi:hypothetical protein